MAAPVITDPRYGIDVDTFWLDDTGALGLDPNFGLISGNRAVAQAIMRLWLSPRGSLITNPDAGIDVREYLGSEIANSPSSLFQLKEALLHEALRDERVDTIELDVSFDTVTDSTYQTIKISARVTLTDPTASPFAFVVAISAVTTSLILDQAA